MDYRTLIAGMLLLGACSRPSRDMVLVVDRTKLYHTPDCTRVKMAMVKQMSRHEARLLHYQPCPGCRPDSLREPE